MSVVEYHARPVQKTSTRPAWQRYVLPLIVPVLLLVSWEVMAQTGLLDTRFFSSPSQIWKVFLGSLSSGRLQSHVVISVSRIVIGFLVGAVPGVALGLLLGVSPLIRSLLGPTLNAIYPLPKIAMLPLFIMVFGLGETSKWATIALGVFFPVLINTLAGVANIDKVYVEVGNNFGASKWNFYRTIALPGALPFIFAGLKIGYGVSLLLIVSAEFVGTTSGIGYMIWNSWQVFRIEDLFIGLVLIAVLGGLGNLILKFGEFLFCPWLRHRR